MYPLGAAGKGARPVYAKTSGYQTAGRAWQCVCAVCSAPREIATCDLSCSTSSTLQSRTYSSGWLLSTTKTSPHDQRKMTITTELTTKLGLRIPVVQGGMQWVGLPKLASSVSNAGGLGILTALTQPSPDALRNAIRECKEMLKPDVRNRSSYGPIAVNITLLPSINPPDYPGYAKAALDEGIRIFETAGNNRECKKKEVEHASIAALADVGHHSWRNSWTHH